MNPYRFEIVRRASGRFGWIFVRIDGRGRRVLAGSERSYRSRKRVRRAIAAFEGAPVVDATKGYLPFPLPATSFRFVPGVVPLIVDEAPLEDRDAVFSVSAAQPRTNDVSAENGRDNDHEEEAAAATPARKRAKAT